MDHYGCMVDLFGHAGHLDEAYNFIKKMPIELDAAVWGSMSIKGFIFIHNLHSLLKKIG
jgi:pentatricopeptide repeat protein